MAKTSRICRLNTSPGVCVCPAVESVWYAALPGLRGLTLSEWPAPATDPREISPGPQSAETVSPVPEHVSRRGVQSSHWRVKLESRPAFAQPRSNSVEDRAGSLGIDPQASRWRGEDRSPRKNYVRPASDPSSRSDPFSRSQSVPFRRAPGSDTEDLDREARSKVSVFGARVTGVI